MKSITKDMLKLNKTSIDFFKKDKSIFAVYLFGSQANGRTNKYSDIDIAVLFDDKITKGEYTQRQIAITMNLTAALNKEIDVIVLNRASLFLRYHILKEGIKIYERFDRTEHNFEAQAIVQYFDFLPVKNRIENGLISKIKEA